MIIRISRSGGFAGIEENLGTINTGNLQKEAAARAEDSIAQITRLLEEKSDYPPVGADMLHYEIEIIDEKGGHQSLVLVDEGDDKSPLMKALYGLLDSL